MLSLPKNLNPSGKISTPSREIFHPTPRKFLNPPLKMSQPPPPPENFSTSRKFFNHYENFLTFLRKIFQPHSNPKNCQEVTAPPPISLFFFLPLSFPFQKNLKNSRGGGVEHPEPPPLKCALTFLYFFKYCTNIAISFTQLIKYTNFVPKISGNLSTLLGLIETVSYDYTLGFLISTNVVFQKMFSTDKNLIGNIPLEKTSSHRNSYLFKIILVNL